MSGYDAEMHAKLMEEADKVRARVSGYSPKQKARLLARARKTIADAVAKDLRKSKSGTI